MAAKIDGRTTDTKQRILREAKRMYLKGGYTGISLQEIALQIDISKPALFHHFKSKQELFFEVLLDLCESNRRAVIEAIRMGSNSHSCLRNVLLAMRSQPFFDPMKFLNEEIDELNEEQQRQIHACFNEGMQGPLIRIMDQGIAAGELRPHNSRIAAMAFANLMMLLPSPGSPLEKMKEREGAEQYVDELFQLFLNGVKKT